MVGRTTSNSEDISDALVLRHWKDAARRRRAFRSRIRQELTLLKRRGDLPISVEYAVSKIEESFILAALAHDLYRQRIKGQGRWENFVRAGEARRKITAHGLQFATNMFVLEKFGKHGRNIGAGKAIERASTTKFSDLSPRDRRAVERLAGDANRATPVPRGGRPKPNEYWIGELCEALERVTKSAVGFSRSNTGLGGPFFRIIRAAVDYWSGDSDKPALKDETIAAYIARRRPQS